MGRAAEASLFGNAPKTLSGRSIYKLDRGVRVNGRPASIDTIVRAADTVETDAGASIVFVVGKDVLILRGASKLVLLAYPRLLGL